MSCNCHPRYSLRDAARDTLKRDYIDKESKNKRLEICQTCPNIMAKMICSRCGCFVTVKSSFKRASCPDGLW